MDARNLFGSEVPTREELKALISPNELFRCRTGYDEIAGFTIENCARNYQLEFIIFRMMELLIKACDQNEAADILRNSWLKKLTKRERRYLIYEAHYLKKREAALSSAFPEEAAEVIDLLDRGDSKKIQEDVFDAKLHRFRDYYTGTCDRKTWNDAFAEPRSNKTLCTLASRCLRAFVRAPST